MKADTWKTLSMTLAKSTKQKSKSCDFLFLCFSNFYKRAFSPFPSFSVCHSWIIDLDDFHYVNSLSRADYDVVMNMILKPPPPISEKLQRVIDQALEHVSCFAFVSEPLYN